MVRRWVKDLFSLQKKNFWQSHWFLFCGNPPCQHQLQSDWFWRPQYPPAGQCQYRHYIFAFRAECLDPVEERWMQHNTRTVFLPTQGESNRTMVAAANAITEYWSHRKGVSRITGTAWLWKCWAQGMCVTDLTAHFWESALRAPGTIMRDLLLMHEIVTLFLLPNWDFIVFQHRFPNLQKGINKFALCVFNEG